MTTNEKNEFVAEKLFNLIKLKTPENCFDLWTDIDGLQKGTLPDFSKNAMPILEKLSKTEIVKICPSITDTYNVEIISSVANHKKHGVIYGFGETIHLAILNAAVQYIKSIEDNNNEDNKKA